MSEPHLEDQAQEEPGDAGQQEDPITWEDAIEDLETQKQIIKAARTAAVASEEAELATESDVVAPDSSFGLDAPNLRSVLDIPLQITVELGRKRLLTEELLQLNQASIIELTQQVGEPFEVLVNQKLIARGEVVVVNDKLGVRINDIISPSERVKYLQ